MMQPAIDHGVRNLAERFHRSAERFPDRPALEVQGQCLSYRDLSSRARCLAAALSSHAPDGAPPLTAVFAQRSLTAFVGILGTLLRGHGYVPLNRNFPRDRTRVMLRRSGARTVIVDSESAEQLASILENDPEPLLLVFPDERDIRPWVDRWPQHTILGAEDLESAVRWEPVAVPSDAIAYLLFTSGSTGIPKGVMVSHRNVSSFIDAVTERYDLSERDRFSQTFDLTFDLSVFDMFVSWEVGGCLCCPPQRALIQPGRFIRESDLSVWFSVPSTGVFMRRLGALKPNTYPHLRLSLFCGEPLPVEVARAWTDAAPQSTVENLYGPTELTIACMWYRWDNAKSPSEAHMGIVPIGTAFPRMRTLIADDEDRPVSSGQEGHLLMAGPQVTLGYLDDPEKTAAAYVRPPGMDEIYYRTGDRVIQPQPDGPVVYLGRKDHQVKILGHRVELGEIEAVVRDETGTDLVVALGWPVTPSGAGGIAVFVGDPELDVTSLRARVGARLPDYMVPRQIHTVERLPLNSNGKFDRRALVKMLEEM